MVRRMLGDMAAVGVVAPLMMIEVSGRPVGRLLVIVICVVLFLLAAVKMMAWEQFHNQVPEVARCDVTPDGKRCPGFFMVDAETGDVALGQTCVRRSRSRDLWAVPPSLLLTYRSPDRDSPPQVPHQRGGR